MAYKNITDKLGIWKHLNKWANAQDMFDILLH